MKKWALSGSAGVREAVSGFETEEAVTKRFGHELTKYHLLQLVPGAWLGGKTINFYMQLLQCRDNKLQNKWGRQSWKKPSKFLSVDFFEKLLAEKYIYNEATKHTRGLNIQETDNFLYKIVFKVTVMYQGITA